MLNLGVSHTGPLSHLAFLEHFAPHPNLREVVWVFYEGNDLEDLDREYRAWQRFKTTGQPEQFEFRRQSSLIRAVGETLRRRRQATGPPPSPPPVYAWFPSSAGPVPVTPGPLPPAAADLSPQTLEALDLAFARFAAFGREQRVRLWLAYMPAKLRVLHGLLDFSPDAPDRLPAWSPTDLPAAIQQRCLEHGIRFIDLTPALTRTTVESGRLPYNARFDLHLNARGAAVVAQTLATRLTQQHPGIRVSP